MAQNLNFVWNGKGANYLKVQEQIFDQIIAELPVDSYTKTDRKRAKDKLNFSLFIRTPADIVMSHGVADKNYFLLKDKAGELIANTLKHVFVPGEWLKRRLVNHPDFTLDESRVHVVGWPRLDHLLSLQAAVPLEAPRARQRVLWAPSHDWNRRNEESVSLSSYPELADHLPFLRKHFDVEVSLHPRNRKSKTPTDQKLIDCDYVISDIGTMVYEAWALGKPVIFPTWIIGDRVIKYQREAAEPYIFQNRIGLHANSPQEIVDMVMGGAPIDDTVRVFLDDYLDPAYNGSSAKRVASLLTQFAPEVDEAAA